MTTVREEGVTALHDAAYASFADYLDPSECRVVEILRAAGADINAKDKDGVSPLDIAHGWFKAFRLTTAAKNPRSHYQGLWARDATVASNLLINDAVLDCVQTWGAAWLQPDIEILWIRNGEIFNSLDKEGYASRRVREITRDLLSAE